MPDGPLDPARAEVEQLRARVSELEAELATLSRPPAEPGPAPPEGLHRQLMESLCFVPWEGAVPALEGDPTAPFRFSYVGPQAAELLGYPLEQWYAPGFWEARLHPEDRDAAIRLCLEASKRGEDHNLEYRLVAAGGRVVWVLDVVRVVLRDGRPWMCRGFLLDVSRRKEAEQQRQKLEEQAYQARYLQSLGVLAGGIAHEFNNLLTTLIGYTDLACGEVPAQSPARGYLAEVLTAGHRAADLTRQLLAYAGKGRFVLQPVVLSDLVRQMSPVLTAAVSRKATLVQHLAEGMPAVEADPSQLRQIILELVRNASEALGEQEGTIHLRTGVIELAPGASEPLAPGRYAVLEVRDTGCGMDAATLARVFEPFFTTKFTGRGLGLAAVQGIVRGHGGLIRASSTPGQGARFEVLLPALTDARPPADAPAPAAAQRPILVVEDDPAVRSLAVLVLGQAGHVTAQAGDGQAALEQFRQRPDHFTAVLLDLTMPGLDGLAVLAELRRLRPDVPVVLMTGYSTHDLASHPAAAAANALLQKPFTAETLLAAVRSCQRPGARNQESGAQGQAAGDEGERKADDPP